MNAARRIRRTVITFSAGTLAMAVVDVTPFHTLTAMIALVGVYGAWLDTR